MAPSLSNAKLLSSFIINTINKRGFPSAAAASQAAKGGAAARTGAAVNKTGEENVRSTEKVSWFSDPRTGFYRSENVTEEIDVVEFGAALLTKH